MDVALHWSGDWPEHLGPLLDALGALPEIDDAPEGTVVLCPDALALAPPPAGDGRPLVALVPDVSALLHPAARAEPAASLGAWVARDAILATPTATGARLLRALPGAGAERVRELALPLAPDRIPAPWPDGGADIVALRPDAYRATLAAARPLRLAGLGSRIVLAGGAAEAIVAPGGLAGHFDLLGGHDVIALAGAQAAGSAGVLVVGEEHSGRGWLLREALATGRPVVAPSTWLHRDHLAAVGADAYLHSGELDGLVCALAAALRGDRGGGLGAAARAAVLAESWTAAARALYRALDDALTGAAAAPAPGPPPAPTSAPVPRVEVTGAGGLAVDVVNLRPSGGGGERFMRSLAAAMAAHRSRPRIRLVCWVDPQVAFDPGTGALREAGVEVVTVTGADPAAAVAGQLRGADVVYCSWPHLAEPPETEAPLVCTYHDLNDKHFDVHGPAQKALLAEQAPRWIARCAAIVHSSRFIAEEMRRFYDVPDGLTHVITLTAEAPGVDGDADDAFRAAVRARHALGDRPFLLSPNGNHLHKNYAALSAATVRLRSAGRPVRVLATGFATDRFHGPDLIGLGYVSAAELAALYAECAGVVQTTLYEAGSFPMMEAMAAGKPVAISAIAPVVEQIERLGLVAETFDPLDVADVADAVGRLWSGSAATAAAAVAANRAAIGARTWDDVAGEYLALLGGVAAPHAPAATRSGA